MLEFASWIRGGTRRLGLAVALVGVALFLAPAEAKTEKADLNLGAGGVGTGAQGRIQIKQQRRGERLKIRLENLEPRTDYEIRDGATDEVLGTVRTDRRGRARKSLRAGADGGLSGAMLEICEPGSDDPILEGKVPGDDRGMPWFDGSYRIGTVSTDPEAAVQVSITLTSTTGYGMDSGTGVGGGGGTFGMMRDDGGNDAPARTYDSISLFAGPGGVWIMEGRDEGGLPELPSIPGPVTFWIESGEDGLVKVATIEKADWGQPIPLMGPANGVPGADGSIDGMIFPMPDSYSWYADNVSEPGLPFGVASVSDLSGRAFEVRDGEDAVLLEGVLPELEEIVIDPLPEPEPYPGFPCPGGDFHIDINIDLSGIDLSGIDWSAIDLSSIDWNSIDFSRFLQGLK